MIVTNYVSWILQSDFLVVVAAQAKQPSAHIEDYYNLFVATAKYLIPCTKFNNLWSYIN